METGETIAREDELMERLLDLKHSRSFHLENRLLLALEEYAKATETSVNALVGVLVKMWYDDVYSVWGASRDESD